MNESAIVYSLIVGVAMFLGGLGLLIPRIRGKAAWLLVAAFIALPALQATGSLLAYMGRPFSIHDVANALSVAAIALALLAVADAQSEPSARLLTVARIGFAGALIVPSAYDLVYMLDGPLLTSRTVWTTATLAAHIAAGAALIARAFLVPACTALLIVVGTNALIWLMRSVGYPNDMHLSAYINRIAFHVITLGGVLLLLYATPRKQPTDVGEARSSESARG